MSPMAGCVPIKSSFNFEIQGFAPSWRVGNFSSMSDISVFCQGLYTKLCSWPLLDTFCPRIFPFLGRKVWPEVLSLGSLLFCNYLCITSSSSKCFPNALWLSGARDSPMSKWHWSIVLITFGLRVPSARQGWCLASASSISLRPL